MKTFVYKAIIFFIIFKTIDLLLCSIFSWMLQVDSAISFELTRTSMSYLRNEELPETIVRELKFLKNVVFLGKDGFLEAVEQQIGKKDTEKYQDQILSSASTLQQYDHGSLLMLYQGQINADICFFGSSRTALHINPLIIQDITGMSAWNLGMDGSNLDQQIFTLEEYLLHNKIPEVVVIEAELPSFDFAGLKFKKEDFRSYKYYSKHTLQLFSQNWQEVWGTQLVSSLIYKMHIPELLTHAPFIISQTLRKKSLTWGNYSTKDLIIHQEKFLLINGAMLRKYEDGNQIVPRKQPMTFNLNDMEDGMNKFEYLARLADKNNFALVLLTSPRRVGNVHPEQHNTANNFYENLAKEWPHVYLFNYHTDDDIRIEPKFWADFTHLNIEGANLLSMKVAQDIEHFITRKVTVKHQN